MSDNKLIRSSRKKNFGALDLMRRQRLSIHHFKIAAGEMELLRAKSVKKTCVRVPLLVVTRLLI